MSDVKNMTAPLEIGGRTYNITLTLNVIDALQDRYGDLNNVAQKAQDVRELVWIITELINESVDNYNDDHDDKLEHIDSKWVGRKVNKDNLAEINQVLLTTFGLAMPKSSEDSDIDEDDIIPNANSEQ